MLDRHSLGTLSQFQRRFGAGWVGAECATVADVGVAGPVLLLPPLPIANEGMKEEATARLLFFDTGGTGGLLLLLALALVADSRDSIE